MRTTSVAPVGCEPQVVVTAKARVSFMLPSMFRWRLQKCWFTSNFLKCLWITFL